MCIRKKKNYCTPARYLFDTYRILPLVRKRFKQKDSISIKMNDDFYNTAARFTVLL